MAKKQEKIIKLQIPAGKANPAPPIGPALGSAGVNIMAFCKEFQCKNAKSRRGYPASSDYCLSAINLLHLSAKNLPWLK